jgi:hypothetical protein
MAKKKITLQELRTFQQDIDQNILQVRKIVETYSTEREKIFSAENRRRLSPEGLREDESKLRQKTEPLLAARNAKIAQYVREAFADREEWTTEHALRNARFFPAYEGSPGTVEAKQNALLHELLEDTRRNSAERRASRYSAADLAVETERAALAGDAATLAVLAAEGRLRDLKGVEKVNFDVAFKKLQIPEITEAEQIFSVIEGLTKEADALFTLWREPRNETALTYESLGRFDRKKRAERFVAETLAADQQRVEGKAKPPLAVVPEQPSAA